MPDTNDEQHGATEADISGSGPACLGTWGCSCLLSGANGASTYYPNCEADFLDSQPQVTNIDRPHWRIPVRSSALCPFNSFPEIALCGRYSAIDMSTFEALKLAYLRSTGKDEPGVMALLAFGSISGSVGATSVYPLNLLRTRLQASGSSGHPQRYTGVLDVAVKTWERDGWRGFYRGLFPTLAKVCRSLTA